jgi:hypothetical protein
VVLFPVNHQGLIGVELNPRTSPQRHEDEEFGFDLDGIKINRAAVVPATGSPMPDWR